MIDQFCLYVFRSDFTDRQEHIRVKYYVSQCFVFYTDIFFYLCSFWGKFGQRSNLTQTKYITEPVEYFDMMTSDSQIVKNIRFVSNEMVHMDWIYLEDFVEVSGRTNVVVAAYTTAQARLKLYEYLKNL